MKVGVRFASAVCVPGQAGIDDEDEHGDADDPAQHLPQRRRRDPPDARLLQHLQLGRRPHRRQRDERDDQDGARPPTRRSSAGSGGPACRRGRGRRRSTARPARAAASAPRRQQDAPAHGCTMTLPICDARRLHLDLEDALDGRRDLVGHASARLRDLLGDVVAVEVHLAAGGVGRDLEGDRVALLEVELLDTADRLAVLDGDRLDLRRGRGVVVVVVSCEVVVLSSLTVITCVTVDAAESPLSSLGRRTM